jgi:integrase
MSKRLGFTNAEIQRLLNAIQDEALRNLFLIAIYTGARRESIVTLRTEDIVPVRRIPCFHFDDKTDAGDRHVPIHTALQPTVTSLCDRAIDGYLFDETARGKNKYSEGDRLGKMFTRLKQGLDFPSNKVFHSTRHGVAERLGELGCPAMTLKDIMGHEKHDTTENYKKAAKAHVMREWIEKLDYTALDEDP